MDHYVQGLEIINRNIVNVHKVDFVDLLLDEVCCELGFEGFAIGRIIDAESRTGPMLFRKQGGQNQSLDYYPKKYPFDEILSGSGHLFSGAYFLKGMPLGLQKLGIEAMVAAPIEPGESPKGQAVGYIALVGQKEGDFEEAHVKLVQALARSIWAHQELARTSNSAYPSGPKSTFEAIVQSKLMTTGEMVGSILHEIANPVSVVKGTALRLDKRLDQGKADDALIRSSCKSIGQSVRLISEVIRTVKGYLYEGASSAEMHPKSVSDIVGTAKSMLKWTLKGSHIELECEEIESSVLLQCQSGSMVQIIINLVSNARDAIRESGRTDGKITIDVVSTGSFVIFGVTDNGPGVPETIRKQIFERNFTTKPEGIGNGMGLAIVADIVRMHHGTIMLDETADGGRFVVTLPKKQPKSDQQAA